VPVDFRAPGDGVWLPIDERHGDRLVVVWEEAVARVHAQAERLAGEVDIRDGCPGCAHIDHAMAGACVEADERRSLGCARALDGEAGTPARPRDEP